MMRREKGWWSVNATIKIGGKVAVVWNERECPQCRVVKKERPGCFKMLIDRRTKAVTYSKLCAICDKAQQAAVKRKAHYNEHARAIKERKQHEVTYEQRLEAMEAEHGPSTRWPVELHMKMSAQLYKDAQIVRYKDVPQPLPNDASAFMPLDPSNPMFRARREVTA